jgi:hypothetical protein
MPSASFPEKMGLDFEEMKHMERCQSVMDELEMFLKRSGSDTMCKCFKTKGKLHKCDVFQGIVGMI